MRWSGTSPAPTRTAFCRPSTTGPRCSARCNTSQSCCRTPYFRNYGKRLIKSPKLYFIDPLIVATLTRQPSPEAALAGPMGVALLEDWIVVEAVKAFTNRGLKPDLYFRRSHDGLEVDLLVQIGPRLHPVEIRWVERSNRARIRFRRRRCGKL